MEDYTIKVNEEEIRVQTSDLKRLDLAQINEDSFHFLQNSNAFDIRLLRADYLNKTMSVSVNGNTYELEIIDVYDRQVKKMGLSAFTTQKVNAVKAPMPGLIVEVMVEEGQEVVEGTPLLVLSAMKMENIIVSQGAGIVKSIEVNTADAVEKGQLIIEME